MTSAINFSAWLGLQDRAYEAARKAVAKVKEGESRRVVSMLAIDCWTKPFCLSQGQTHCKVHQPALRIEVHSSRGMFDRIIVLALTIERKGEAEVDHHGQRIGFE